MLPCQAEENKIARNSSAEGKKNQTNIFKNIKQPVVKACTFNPSTLEREAGEPL